MARKRKRKKKKWGKVGAPHSAKRKRFLSGIRKKSRRRKRKRRRR